MGPSFGMSERARSSIEGVSAMGGQSFGGKGFRASCNLAGSYMSQYFFGATNERCGFKKPTARKNGLSLCSRRARMAVSAVTPSAYAWSGTSSQTSAGPGLQPPPPFFPAVLALPGPLRIAAARPLDRFQRPRLQRFGPRSRILFSAVEDLSDGHGHVTVVLEMLRQRDHVRVLLAEMRVVMQHPGRVRPQAGEQTGTGGTAERLLAVGAGKDHAPCRQPVNVRAS